MFSQVKVLFYRSSPSGCHADKENYDTYDFGLPYLLQMSKEDGYALKAEYPLKQEVWANLAVAQLVIVHTNTGGRRKACPYDVSINS